MAGAQNRSQDEAYSVFESEYESGSGAAPIAARVMLNWISRPLPL